MSIICLVCCLLWVEVFPSGCVCWNLNPQEAFSGVTLFGDSIFTEVLKLGWGHQDGPYSSKTGVLVKGKICTRNEIMHKGKVMWRDAGKRHLSPSQGERTGADPSLAAIRRTKPCHNLLLDFQPASLWDRMFLLCKPLSLCNNITAALENSYRALRDLRWV